MQRIDIKTCQNILEQLKHCQSEIDYSRYLSQKKDFQWVIENAARIEAWQQQLLQTTALVEQHSQNLQQSITQNTPPTANRQALELAIDQLIELHTEIAKSYAHQTDLMEGRYLMLNAAGSCLDQVSAQINEFRYQLGNVLFACAAQKPLKTIHVTLAFHFSIQIELAALQTWFKEQESKPASA